MSTNFAGDDSAHVYALSRLIGGERCLATFALVNRDWLHLSVATLGTQGNHFHEPNIAADGGGGMRQRAASNLTAPMR